MLHRSSRTSGVSSRRPGPSAPASPTPSAPWIAPRDPNEQDLLATLLAPVGATRGEAGHGGADIAEFREIEDPEPVREEIAAELRTEKRRTALAELAASVEEQFEDGAALTEVARELGLTLESTGPVTATGEVYGTASETAPAVLAPALASAFEMNEGEPQIAEVEPGRTFLVYEATEIVPSAAAPLREIRDDVTAAWRRSVGAEAAKDAADRVLARIHRALPGRLGVWFDLVRTPR